MPRARPDDADELQTIPGVGPSLARDLRELGIEKVADLRGRDPAQLFQDLEARVGHHVDRCVLYVFRSSVYFAAHADPEDALTRWWNWKDGGLAERRGLIWPRPAAGRRADPTSRARRRRLPDEGSRYPRLMRSTASVASFSPPVRLWYPQPPAERVAGRSTPHSWAISSAGERPPHTREVVGSNPTSPTTSPLLPSVATPDFARLCHLDKARSSIPMKLVRAGCFSRPSSLVSAIGQAQGARCASPPSGTRGEGPQGRPGATTANTAPAGPAARNSW